MRFCFTRSGHNAQMGLPVSLILITVGAVLAFAVHQHAGASVDVHVVGWVLLAVGLVGILLSLFWWEPAVLGLGTRPPGPPAPAPTPGHYDPPPP